MFSGRQEETAWQWSVDLEGQKRIVLKAVHQNGMALQFASSTLQNDQEVVLEADQNY